MATMAPAFQQAPGFPNGFRDVARAPLSSREFHLRAAIQQALAARGSGGLQDRRIPPGGRAHFERSHGRARAVVGNIVNDGEARPAIRALMNG